jgi:hypothetical protein
MSPTRRCSWRPCSTTRSRTPKRQRTSCERPSDRAWPRWSSVVEVTDDKALEKAERKALQIEHAAGLSPAAKQLRIADKICNIRDITESPPKHWPVGRKLEYLVWASQVVDRCRGFNPDLDAAFDQVVREARDALGGV